MSTPTSVPNPSTVRPPAVGRSAINEFRKARARFRQDRASADQAAEEATVANRAMPADTSGPAEPVVVDAFVVVAHAQPLSLALARRRRDESATLDRRLRLRRMIAREDRLAASMASMSATSSGSVVIVDEETIDLREGAPVAGAVTADGPLADVVDLRRRRGQAASEMTGTAPRPRV
jgi:hypothetical protein